MIAPRPRLAYVGCRTTKERQGRGEGISVFEIDGASGAWRLVQLVRPVVNPSYLAFDRSRRFLYAVHADIGGVSAYRVEPGSGQLTFINTQASGGRNPVHLTTDLTNRFLIVANYASDNLGALPIKADGSLGELADTLPFAGPLGPHKSQQVGIYPHQCPFDPNGRFLFVPQKGGDRVDVVAFDSTLAKFQRAPNTVATRSGAGPRHIVLHPHRPFAYLANELDTTIATYAWDRERGQLSPLQILPSLPPNYTGNNTTAAIRIAPSGRHVYISNRGHDSIGIFAVDDATGTLAPIGWEGTRGRQPRFFRLDRGGHRLYVANELGDSIVIFDIDPKSGRLTATGEPIATPTPTCIVFGY